MEIHEQHRDGMLVLRIHDQIDSATGSALADKLEEVIGKGHLFLILDLSNVPYISSAGLRVLSIALKSVRDADKGGDICLASLSRTVAHAFRISGFNQVFNIYDTVSEAVTAMAASRESFLD